MAGRSPHPPLKRQLEYRNERVAFVPNILAYNEKTRAHAIDFLKNDGVIVAPSVTNYGVFCSAHSAVAIARIFEMKKRTKFGPLTLGVPTPSSARQFSEVPAGISDEMLADLLYGMATPIFFKTHEFPAQMTMGAPTVGIMCQGKSPMFEIGREFGPIALTSANISGTGGFQVSREQAIEDLGELADLVVDDGPIHWDENAGENQSNTVVDFTFDRPYLVREGRFATDRLRQMFPLLVDAPGAYREALTERMGAVRL